MRMASEVPKPCSTQREKWNTINYYSGGALKLSVKKLLCMKKAVFRGKQETLAEYYVRAHGHLLEDVSVIEISDDGTIKIVRDGASIPAEAYYG